MPIINMVDLRDHPQFLPVLADWHHREWAVLNPGQTLEQRMSAMRSYLAEARVPSIYLATIDGHLVGSAAIVACDMDTRTDLTPWLASVFVSPEFRRQGVGSYLVRHAMGRAREDGFETMHLFTPDRISFYQRLGWRTLSKDVYRGHQVTVMSVGLL